MGIIGIDCKYLLGWKESPVAFLTWSVWGYFFNNCSKTTINFYVQVFFPLHIT